LSINYGTGIIVQSGPPANGTLTPAAVVVYRAGGNVITASGITDAYGNACSGIYTMTESYTGTYSGFTISNLNITLSNGSGTAITSAFNQVYGVITYHLNSMQCSFNVWMNPNYRLVADNTSVYAVDNTGHVWAWGSTPLGNGQGSGNAYGTPISVPNISNIKSVSLLGGENGYALDNSGNVWAWGDGPIGNGTTTGSLYPVETISTSNIVSISGSGFAITDTGNVLYWGNGYLFPVQINVSNIISIVGGDTGGDTYFLDSSGHVWAAGTNQWGQLGNPSAGNGASPLNPVEVITSSGTPLSNIVAVAGGTMAGYALDSSGHVWAWGDGRYGELGIGWTPNEEPYPVQVNNLSNIIAIAGGYTSGYALDSFGHVWAWGDDNVYQLGDNSTNNELSPIQVPNLNNIVAITAGELDGYALDSSGKIWAWGGYYNGALGNVYNGGTTPGQITQSGWTAALP
jgi:alpha-tubulin suppressor-like RCC1 family protein